MLILTGNKVVNSERVFFFSVEKNTPCFADSGMAYLLRAYCMNGLGCVALKFYPTEQVALEAMTKIAESEMQGAPSINLDTD